MNQKKSFLNHLICPVSHEPLRRVGEELISEKSNFVYPIKNGIPILIDESNSIFSIEEITNTSSTESPSILSKIKSSITYFFPTIGNNFQGEENFNTLTEILIEKNLSPKVLVIGGAWIGSGMESMINEKSITLIETDIYLSERTDLICDGHSIPFEDGYFDGVIIQAVLEHVVDPFKCVDEIHRVLKKDGLIYSETPFMQQVHMGKYDFTRFTHLGHRRLFRNFKELDSGIVCGPGMALAWSIQYFLLSFTTSLILRKFFVLFTNFIAFPFKYFDYFLKDKKGAYDSASGFFFLGTRSEETLSDKDLIKLYRGAL